MTCFMHLPFLGVWRPTSWGGDYTRVCIKKGEERRKEEGREEATERGLVSSHCSIKSVGNDQD